MSSEVLVEHVDGMVIVEQRDWPTSKMFTRQESITGPVLKSADAREGAAAFAEKRPPHWKGT